jgi:hypothetical protein
MVSSVVLWHAGGIQAVKSVNGVNGACSRLPTTMRCHQNVASRGGPETAFGRSKLVKWIVYLS